jgi:hypothetical protein
MFYLIMFKGIRTSKTTWLVWNFDVDLEELSTKYPYNRITRFHRVRKLDLRQRNDHYFLHCSCGFYNRIGIPCPHFFFVFPHMEVESFHVRNWKVFDAYYGFKSDLGNYVNKAQEQYFLNEKHGIPVPKRIMQISDIFNERFDSASFPLLCQYTEQSDVDDAMFVKKLPCCTHDDLFHRRYVSCITLLRTCTYFSRPNLY